MKKPIVKKKPIPASAGVDYSGLLGGVSELLEAARRASARAVNAFMAATYWEVGRRIVEFEQYGEKRAGYGEEVLARLANDLTTQFGRGFSRQNLQRFRQFYLSQPTEKIRSTLSSNLTDGIRPTPSSIAETLPRASQAPSGKSFTLPIALSDLAHAFPLPWSHYVLLISRARSPEAFAFYHTEALPTKLLVREYLTALPDEKVLAAELEKTRKQLEARK